MAHAIWTHRALAQRKGNSVTPVRFPSRPGFAAMLASRRGAVD
jgi:hypothetical protein